MTTTCPDCGVLVDDSMVHRRFHSILDSHAHALAILIGTHLSARRHDRYDVSERINSKRFDNWSADALAEVAGPLDNDGIATNEGTSATNAPSDGPREG